MKYKFSENNKRRILKRYQLSMSIQYMIPLALFSYMLFSGYSDSVLELKLILILGLLSLPAAWWYFNRNMKNKLSSEYEVYDGKLNIYEKGQIKKSVPLESIRKLVKIPNGHRVESNYGDTYILDGIDDKEGVLSEIDNQISNYR